MKILISFVLVLSLISCEYNSEKVRFYNTYRQILNARAETNDSLAANAKVMEILKKNGYTEQQFRRDFFELAAKEKDFIRTIDSLRNSAKKEYQQIIDSTKSKDATDKE